MITRLFFIVILCIFSSLVSSQQDFLFDDYDSDGTIDNVEFVAFGYTIKVFDGDGDMKEISDINSCCDTDSDYWIIGDDLKNIIVVYENTSDGQKAMVYDDIDGDNQVSYTYSGSGMTVDEGYPRLVFKTMSDSFVSNRNIMDLAVDIQGDINFSIENNSIRIKLVPGLTTTETKASIYYIRDNSSICSYSQFIDHSGSEIFPLIHGCILPLKRDVLPVIGPIIGLTDDHLLLDEVGLFIQPDDGDYLLFTKRIGIDRHMGLGFRRVFIGQMLKQESADGIFDVLSGIKNVYQKHKIFMLLRREDHNTPIFNRGQSYKIASLFDVEGDGNADYNLMYIPFRKKLIELNHVYNLSENLIIPSRKFTIPQSFYKKYNGVTIFSLFEGEDDIHYDFYVNNFYPSRVKSVRSKKTILPPSIGGRIERTFKKPVFYWSQIDDRIHLLNVTEGSWLIDSLESNLVDSYYLNSSILATGNLAGLDVVLYYDTDSDAFIDRWDHFKNGRLVDTIESKNNFILYLNESLRIKKYNVSDVVFDFLNESHSIDEDFFYGKLLNSGSSLSTDIKDVFDKIDATPFFCDLDILDIKHTSKSIVFEAYCNSDCIIGHEGYVNQSIQRGKYLIEYDGDYKIHKLSGFSSEIRSKIDSFFNSNSIILLLVLICVSTLIFFVLWEGY